MHKKFYFCLFSRLIARIFVLLHLHSAKSAKDILLNSFTITTATQRAKLLLLGLYPKGAAFPYKEVVCGEP